MMRIKQVFTGHTVNGVPQIIELQDDGYRIRFRWVTGIPNGMDKESDFDPEATWVWAEYKHCDWPGAASFIADLLMSGAKEMPHVES